MPETTVDAPAKLPSEASDREEYKLIRSGTKVPATAQPPSERTQTDDTTESAAASGTAETDHTQDQAGKAGETVRRDKSLDGRIAELRAAGKHREANKLMVDAATKAEKERADRLEEELRTLRTRKPEEPAAQTKTPASAAASGDDPAPKQADYDGSEGKTYEDYLIDKARWGYRQEQRTERQASERASLKQTFDAKLAAAREKFADFDAVCAGDAAKGTGFIMTPSMQQFAMAHDAGLEVLYKLASQPAEYRRVFALHPALQLAELGVIARDLAASANSGGGAGDPEKPKPAASRAPAPPPRAGGAESPAPKDPREARNREEYQRLREAQRKR